MVPTRHTAVTPKLTATVEAEIEAAQIRRRQALEDAISELHDHIEAASLAEGPDFFEITGTLWQALMLVGLRAVELICARRRQAPARTRAHDGERRCYHYLKEKSFKLRCVFGEGTMTGSQYVRGSNARSGDELCPQLEELGLLSIGGALGPRIALECAHMSSICAFSAAKAQLERCYGYVPSTRAMQGLVDRFGPLAGQLLDEAPCPSGDVVIVQLDGRGLPKIRPEEYAKRCRTHTKGADAKPRRRRNDARYLDSKLKPGHKKSKKREVTVGIIYGLDRNDKGGWVVTGKHYFARLGDRRATMAHLGRKLEELEDEPEKVLLLSDGAPQYTDLCEEYLPQATHVIDYYHVCEYIWAAAGAVRHDSELAHEAWVRLLKQFLCEGKPELVVAMLKGALANIPKRGPGTRSRREQVETAIEYIRKRTDMMPYKDLLTEELEIGSGAVESAVRQVVELRFDGPGMRWGDTRPQHMLNLVCARLSGQWEMLEERIRKEAAHPQKIRRMTPKGVKEERQMKAAA
jgi:hypothetical protein